MSRLNKVYIISNSVNDKVYVGQTSRSLSTRFTQHKSAGKTGRYRNHHFYNAIRKYGMDKFAISEVASAPDTSNFEKLWIIVLRSDNPDYGYNISSGGEAAATGMRHTDEWRKAHSERISGENHPLYGKHHSAETRKKIGAVQLGRRSHLFRHDAPVEKCAELYNQGLSSLQIASLFDITKKAVLFRLKEAGVDMRPTGRHKKAVAA